MRRPLVPASIDIPVTAPGHVSGGSGGNYLSADGRLGARLAGADAAAFFVARLATFDVEAEPDTRPPQLVLALSASVDGAGPIDAFGGQAILVTVDFTCPSDPAQAVYQAVAILADAAGTDVMTVPVRAHAAVGRLQASVVGNPPIAAGSTATFAFEVTSTLGHDTPFAFRCDARFEPLFTAPTAFPPAVPANGHVRFDVPVTCSGDAPAGLRSVVFQILSADQAQVLGSIEFGITVVVPLPLPPPHVPVDPSIVWEETSDLAIEVDRARDAWHAGRLTDILLRSDGIFVSASTGGVWGIDATDPDAQAGCTTDDVDNPNFNCLAFGPDSPLQIYGGCASLQPGAFAGGGLYLRGLSTWRAVPIVDTFGQPVLTDDIHRIVVLAAHRTIVLATDRGVFVSSIPGGAVTRYAFTPATGLPPGRYSGLCEGPQESVVASLWGPNGGIFVGRWQPGGRLVFMPSQLISDATEPNLMIDVTQVRRSSLASGAIDRMVMYAVFADLGNRIYRILRSGDGGGTWRAVRNLGTSVVKPGLLAPLAPDAPATDPPANLSGDFAGSTGAYTNCIAVGAHDSRVVAIGWANGPWLTSDAAAPLSRWNLAYEQSTSPHVHGDIQFIRFDPADGSDRTIYVASDGGLMVTVDRAGEAGFRSHLSKHLRNLQFYANAPYAIGGQQMGFAGGGICASPTTPGLLAGPTQDNGNLFCNLEGPDSKAWKTLDGGDGAVVRFLTDGTLLSASPGSSPFEVARLARWNGSAFVDMTTVPVTSPSLPGLSLVGDAQPVTRPHFMLPGTDKRLHAVASSANAGGQLINAYGLFSDGTIGSAEWVLIATLPLARGDAISAIASLNGDQVFVGTKQARVFSFAPFQTPFELTVSTVDKGTVHDIVVVRDALAFALHDGPSSRVILQSAFFGWDPLGSNENVARGLFLDRTETFTGLAVDRATNPVTLFACTDSRVFVSRDEGDTWLLAPTRLPRRVHATSLAVGAARAGARYLYLGTCGRSAWQARL